MQNVRPRGLTFTEGEPGMSAVKPGLMNSNKTESYIAQNQPKKTVSMNAAAVTHAIPQLNFGKIGSGGGNALPANKART